MKTNTLILVLTFILASAALRVINAEYHVYNLIPIAAMGIFSGSVLSNKRLAYMIPLGAMLLSDLGLELFTTMQGFYGISQVVNYAALVLVTFMGTALHNRKVLNILGYTLSGSLVFFILSNFGTYLSGYYGYGLSSLVTCYTMAIPFYKSEMATSFFMNSLLGDLLFSGLAFGAYHYFYSKKAHIITA